jgi:hypothetical protein
MGLTYNNGNKTDNWCVSHKQVPVEMIPPTHYTSPMYGIRNIFTVGTMQIENSQFVRNKDHFLCM